MVDKTSPTPTDADAPVEPVTQPTPNYSTARKLSGLAIAGIIVGSLVLLGGSFGAGAFVGSHVARSHSLISFMHDRDSRPGMGAGGQFNGGQFNGPGQRDGFRPGLQQGAIPPQGTAPGNGAPAVPAPTPTP